MSTVAPTQDGCLEWPGSTTSAGYGHMKASAGTWVVTHRLAFQLARGPIEPGLVLDHLCRNRRCCNPAHLRAVTQRENILAGSSPTIRVHVSEGCAKGHDRATYGYARSDRPGQYECSACMKERRPSPRSPRRREQPPADCAGCGVALPLARDPRRVYCSDACGQNAWRRRQRRTPAAA
jgi:predicted nucleic acid-binding Zn ribbon protein